jgi:hypothetical protein
MKNNVVLNKYNNFYNNPIDEYALTPNLGEEEVVATTLRLPARLKKYYDLMADSCGITAHAAICQVLSGNMEQHVNNQAVQTFRERSNRFFAIFSMHGVAIHDISKFLKEFGVTSNDLNDDIKISDMLSNKMVSFLSETFNLNKEWVSDGIGEPHRSFCCYKDLSKWLAFMEQQKSPIKLKLFFDQDILKNTAICDNLGRDVKPILITEGVLNEVAYKKLYNLHALNWDYHKTHKHIYGLIEGMNITETSGGRLIEKFAGNIEETWRYTNFTIKVLDNFQNNNTSFREANFSAVNKALSEIKNEELETFKKYGDDISDFHSIQREIERLRNNDLNFVPNLI